MSLKIYNSLTNKLEEFTPINGNKVNTSSNNPKNEPKHIKIKVNKAIKVFFLSLNLLIILLTITCIPLVSLIIWKAPDITNKNKDNINNDNPSLENNTKTNPNKPFFV